MSHPAVVGLLFAAALVHGVLPEVLFYIVATTALCILTPKDGLREKATMGTVKLALAGGRLPHWGRAVALFLLPAAVLPIGVAWTWKTVSDC